MCTQQKKDDLITLIVFVVQYWHIPKFSGSKTQTMLMENQ